MEIKMNRVNVNKIKFKITSRIGIDIINIILENRYYKHNTNTQGGKAQ